MIGAATVATLGVSVVSPPAIGAVRGRDPSPIVVTAGKPENATGSVRVSLALRDGRKASFRLPATTGKGTITRRSPTGASFTYRPTPSSRHQAAKDGATRADRQDTFAVTISDGYGGTVSVPISLRVSPRNTMPVANPVVSAADGNGVVTGNVGARDADGDNLTYTVTTPPSRGSVVVGPNGDFTYTPNARSVQRSLGTDVDTFVITVTDGYGGSTAVPITCPAHG